MLREYIRRLWLLIAGSAVSSIGVVCMLQANVGLEPWSVLHQGMSQCMGVTYGTASMIVGAAAIGAAALCGESFGLGTVGNILFCGVMIDGLLYLGWVPKMEALIPGLLLLLAGLEILTIGTWMYMKSALRAGPRDSLMVALARKSGRSVGFCRGTVELLVVFIGWRLGGQVGIGTVVAAVGFGSLLNLNFALLRFRPTDLRQENLTETLRRIGGRS